MTAALEARGLSAGYPGLPPAVRGVDFTLRPGMTMGVIGPNGAGKSTLLKACLGLLPKAAGSVSFFGQPFASVRKKVAYVPQRSAIDWDFPATALDVVLMGRYALLPWYRPLRGEDRAAARAALETVGLSPFADRRISDLSGGQQQRVFLARALAADPALLVLDEPLTGIDAPSEAVILDVLGARARAGGAVLMVHHDLASARRIFDHTLVLAGTAVAEGPPSATLVPEVLARAYGGQLVTLEGAAAPTLILDSGA